MEASNSRKRSCADRGSAGGDCLSNLPDVLLHTILSYLKARQLVQTSVLSKRWRHLWRSVPYLDIDQREFSPNEREKFEDFTDNLLAHRNGSLLDTFHLHISGEFTEQHMDASRWIRRGLKCSPRVFHFYDRVSYVAAPLPNLDSNACCLRKVHLYGVRLLDSFSEQIGSLCMLLEVLELKSCRLSFHEIVFPTLKNLIVEGCIIDFFTDAGIADTEASDALSIMAPHLSHLHVVLNVNTSTFSVSAMPLLLKATIRLGFNEYEKMRYNQWLLVSNLCNATSLELCGLQTMVMPYTEPAGFPVFKNLSSLLLDRCDMSENFQLLALFLQNSPNLEKLTVSHCKFSKGSSHRVNLVGLQCGKLKSTKIMYRDGDNSRELINVMLDNSGQLPNNIMTLTQVPYPMQIGYGLCYR
ncbi:unnamed protein product [Urochloa humidicola]